MRRDVNTAESKNEDWQEYVEHLEFYFVDYGMKDVVKKWAAFLATVATLKTLRNLLSPGKPGEKTFEELVDMLSHHKKTPSESVNYTAVVGGLVNLSWHLFRSYGR